jgi:hypothetical protein
MRPALLASILTALALEGCGQKAETTACLQVDPGTATCPAAADVSLDEVFDVNACGTEIVAIDPDQATPAPSDGGFDTATFQCCYQATSIDRTPMSDCVIGRPLLVNGEVVVAPCGGDATAWTRMAQMEHASVASFARLTLQLMAHAAPLDLIGAVQAAAADEVRHAAFAFAEASKRGGETVAPGALPSFAVDAVTLAQLAAAAVREGCVGESVGALLLADAALVESDPVVAAALAEIAADESRHAALSWRIVAWAMRVGGADVRDAVRAAFAERVVLAPEADGPLAALGVDGARRSAQSALDEVIQPAMDVLLAA